MSDKTMVAAADPDSESCLCVVASYANAAGRVSSVTAEAARRIMMSPVTGDFIELRFATLGAQPGLGSDISGVARPISAAIASPRQVSGRNYFALVMVDRSALAVEQVLRTCATAPFLGDLRLRLLGIASVDDRRSDQRDHYRGSTAQIVVAPSGAWRQESELVAVLRGFGEELLRHFATSREPGFSAEDLARLVASYKQQSAAPPAASQPTVHDDGAQPDILSDDATAPSGAGRIQQDRAATDDAQPNARPAEEQPADDQAAESRRQTVLSAPAIEAAADHPEPARPAPANAGMADGQQDAAAGVRELASEYESVSEEQTASPAQRPAGRFQRLIPARLRRTGEQELTCDPLPARNPVRALLYLLITGDGTGDRAAWNRSRDAMLDVDQKIASMAGLACEIRALQGNDDALRGELRAAGRLSRREISRVADEDFAAVLEKLTALLRRDKIEMTGRNAAHVRLAVVFFAPDPPLADSATTEAFAELAAEAMLIWVVPKESEGLLAQGFRNPAGVQVITDHEATAGEIVAQLTLDSTIAEAESDAWPGAR